MDEEAQLEWSMAAAGQSLRVTYQVKNVSGKALHVCDSLLVDGSKPNTYRRAPGRFVVRNGDSPGEVFFILGQVGTQAKLYFIYPVTFREVAPGASLSGQADLPLPLEPWHPQGHAAPFPTPPRTARLIIHHFSHAPDWTTVPADDGSTIQVPREYAGGFAMTDPLPLP